ncbi:pentatricopeptide repeat (PPR) superfamily protein [Wolffia australiana]
MGRALRPKHVVAAIRCQTDPLRALEVFDAVAREDGFAHTPATFAAMAGKLARHARFAEMERVLADMRAGCGGDRTEAAYVCAIRGYGRAGRVHDAADAFERLDLFGVAPSAASYNAVMGVLVEHGFPDQAHKVYLRMLHAGVVPDHATFAVRIKAFCRTRRPLAAVRLLRAMPDPTAAAFCFAVAALYEASLRAEASVLFDDMLRLGLSPAIVDFNKLAHALCNLPGGGLAEAARLLGKVLRRGGAAPNGFTFNIFLRGMCAEGRAGEATAWLERRAQEEGADVVAFNTVMAGLCRSSRAEEAAGLLRRMTNAGCFPDSFSYNTVIDGLCRAGNVAAARRLLRDAAFRGFVPDRFTVGSLVHGLCLEGDLAGAAAALREAAAAGVRPDAAVCNALIRGLCRQRGGAGLAQALELSAEMAEAGSADAWTYNTVVHGLCRAGRVAEARALVDAATAEGHFLPDAFTFNAIVDGLCRGRPRRLDEALELVRRMWTAHGVRPDAVTFNCVLDALGKAGRAAEVERAFHDMAAAGCAPTVVTCNILIHALCTTRRAADAARLLARMRGQAATAHPHGESEPPLPPPDAVSFGTVIHGLCAAGELKEAMGLFREMERDGHPLTAATYNLLIAGFGRQLQPRSAVELFAEMQRRGCPPDAFTFRELVAGFCRAGDAAGALELVRRMMAEAAALARAPAMAATFGRVIDALCADHRTADAVDLVVDMAGSGAAPPTAAAAIFDAEKRVAAAPKILVEELLRNGHITYHAYELLYDGVRARKHATARRRRS